LEGQGIESGMISAGSDTIPGHLPVQGTLQLPPGSDEQDSKEEDEHFPQIAWTPAPPAPKGEGTEPSVHTTTSDVGRLLKKSAAASDQPWSEREQPSIKVVTMKFGWESKG